MQTSKKHEKETTKQANKQNTLHAKKSTQDTIHTVTIIQYLYSAMQCDLR